MANLRRLMVPSDPPGVGKLKVGARLSASQEVVGIICESSTTL
jgi:hypothetical protein